MNPYNESYRSAEQGVRMVMKTAQTILSSDLSEEEQGDHMDSLRSVIENYIVNFSKFEQDLKLTQELKGNLTKLDVSEWPDVGQEFKKLQTQNAGKLKVDVKSHPWMKEFDRLVSDNDNNQEEEGDGDEDMMMVSSQIQTVCPITRREMVRPVRNRACGHVYDREGIEALMRQNADTRCPVVGCRNPAPVFPRNLQDDLQTRKAIAAKKKN